MKPPKEDFVVVADGLKLLHYFEELQDISKSSIRALSGPFEPLVDRFYQYAEARQPQIDQFYLHLNSNNPGDILLKHAAELRIEARENIAADIKLFYDAFPNLNLPDQYRQIDLLKKRQAYLHDNGLDKYQVEYIEAEKKLFSKMTENIINDLVNLNAITDQTSKSLSHLEKMADDIFQLTSLTTADVVGLQVKFDNFVKKSREYADDVMQQILKNNSDTQLTHEQVIHIENRLSEFEYRYNQGLAKQDQQYQITHVMLAKILFAEEQRKKVENTEQTMRAVEGTFCAIQQLGTIMQNDTLAKVGQLGQVGTSIIKNIGMLTGSFGYAAVGGLAMLGPISAIAMGGMALIGLFGKKRPSDIKILSDQIADFRCAMERYLGYVLDNQQIIIGNQKIIIGNQKIISDQVVDLYRFVAQDLKVPIDYKLDTILEVIAKNQQENWIGDYDKGLQTLYDDITAVKSLINGGTIKKRNVFEKQKAFDLEGKLAYWVEYGAKRPTFVGAMQKNNNIEDLLVDVATNISYQGVHLQTLPLAVLASLVDSGFPTNIQVSDLVNVKIFSMALEYYNRLVACKGKLDQYNHDTLQNANKILSKFYEYVGYLGRHCTVFLEIIKIYQQNYSEIHTILNHKFCQEKQRFLEKNNVEFTLQGMVGALFDKDSELGLRLRKKLQVMDACRTVICAYSLIAGISNDSFLQKAAYSSVDILNVTVDWSSKNCMTKSSNQSICAVTARYNNKEVVYLITHELGNIILKCYDAVKNSWLDVSSIKTIAAQNSGHSRLLVKTVTYKETDYICLLIQEKQRIKMNYFDVQGGVWHCDMDTPIIKNNDEKKLTYPTTIRLITMKMQNESKLFMVMCGLEFVTLQSYDFDLNKWGLLTNGPAWPQKPNFLKHGIFTTFDAMPITEPNGMSKIMILLRDRKGLQLASYDSENHWQNHYSKSTAIPAVQILQPFTHSQQKIITTPRPFFPGLISVRRINVSQVPVKKSRPSYYNSTRYTKITVEGIDYIAAVTHGANGLSITAFNQIKNSWENWSNPTNKNYEGPDWSFKAGYGREKFLNSLRVTTICLSGINHLVCGISNKYNYDCHVFNPVTRIWSVMLEKPVWNNDVFKSISCANSKGIKKECVFLLPVTTEPNHQQLALLAYTTNSIDYWQCQLKISEDVMSSKSDYIAEVRRNSYVIRKIGIFSEKKSSGTETKLSSESNCTI